MGDRGSIQGTAGALLLKVRLGRWEDRVMRILNTRPRINSFGGPLVSLGLDGTVVKNPPASAGDAGLIPLRRKWQPTPVFLPGKFHGQRNLMGYSHWGCKRVEHDLVTEHTRTGVLGHICNWKQTRDLSLELTYTHYYI